MPLNSIFDTTEYIIELRPEYSNFPTDFSGNLQILSPDCTIPLNYTLLPTEGVFDLEFNIQISPNPASDEIRILNKSDIVISTLEIYNSMGKLLILENESTDSIRISTLVPGIYYVRIYSNKRMIAIKKLIKI